MRERGDLHCLHEPFMYDYYLNPQKPETRRDMPHFRPESEHPHDYPGIRNMILEQAESTPVFFKDMSYYMKPYLDTENEFFTRISHGFLIRNPQATIASYFKMDESVTLEEIGIEAQWQHVEALQGMGIHPFILEAEAVQRDPQMEIKKWWQSIGLNSIDSAFSWSSEPPSDWTQVQAWHQSSIANNTIRKRNQKDDEIEKQRFDNAVIKAPHLQDYLEYHMPFYQRMLAQIANNGIQPAP